MEQSIIIYEPDKKSHLEVKTDGETVWLTQEQKGQLFGRDQLVVARHISNIFKEGELPQEGFMRILHKPSIAGGRSSAPPEQLKHRQIGFIRYDEDGNPVNSTRNSRK